MAFTQTTPPEPFDAHLDNIPNDILTKSEEKIPENVTLPEIPQTP